MRLTYTMHHDGSWTVCATYKGRKVWGHSVSRFVASWDAVSRVS